MVSVLADPVAFDSRQIRVQAVLHLEFEGDRICLDRDSALDFVPRNCVRFSLSDEIAGHYSDIQQFNGQYVMVTGTLHSKDRPTDHFPARIMTTCIQANLPTSRSEQQN